MTPNPDFTPVGFAATDAPEAIVRRRRNPVWLVVAVLLACAGVAGIVLFVAAQLDNAPGRDEAVASGRIAALDDEEPSPVRFDGEGAYTVWLDTDGVVRSNRRETIVAATNCVALFENGNSARFRGGRQGSNVTIGDQSTIGTFDAPDEAIELSCRLLPFGRYGNRFLLRNERPFFVTPGRPGVRSAIWVGMFGGAFLLILAPLAWGRYRAGMLRPTNHFSTTPGARRARAPEAFTGLELVDPRPRHGGDVEHGEGRLVVLEALPGLSAPDGD